MTSTVADWPTPGAPVQAEWITLPPRAVDQAPLRCWWARPAASVPRGGVLVLPEVFGVNAWVRSVAERLAADGYAALAMPLFSRTAPDLELPYDEASLREGRSHKERTTTPQLLDDLALAADWLQQALERPGAGLGCVGFCFGGHVAMLAATLPAIAATVSFYGAGVAGGRPGGGSPTLDLVPTIQGRLLCICGSEDPLIPAADREVTAAALAAANQDRPAGCEHSLRVLEGGHGFMCEARSDHQPGSAQDGWAELLAWFERGL